MCFLCPQRIFQIFQFCYKHFQIVKFCIEIQISFLYGIVIIKKSDYLRHHFSSQCNTGVETRSHFAWQPWTGFEHLSHWRLWYRWVWQSPPQPPPSPACVHYSAPTGGWVWQSCPRRTVPQKVSGWSSPTTQGDIPLLHFSGSYSSFKLSSESTFSWKISLKPQQHKTSVPFYDFPS